MPCQDMKRRGVYGHIINMVGLSGHRIPDGPTGGGFYCATKSAVKTITEALRQEVSGARRRVASRRARAWLAGCHAGGSALRAKQSSRWVRGWVCCLPQWRRAQALRGRPLHMLLHAHALGSMCVLMTTMMGARHRCCCTHTCTYRIRREGCGPACARCDDCAARCVSRAIPCLQARGAKIPLRVSGISPGVVETEFFSVRCAGGMLDVGGMPHIHACSMHQSPWHGAQ